jgi:hypothetical protein
MWLRAETGYENFYRLFAPPPAYSLNGWSQYRMMFHPVNLPLSGELGQLVIVYAVSWAIGLLTVPEQWMNEKSSVPIGEDLKE